jgi:hypothetical protein
MKSESKISAKDVVSGKVSARDLSLEQVTQEMVSACKLELTRLAYALDEVAAVQSRVNSLTLANPILACGLDSTFTGASARLAREQYKIVSVLVSLERKLTSEAQVEDDAR